MIREDSWGRDPEEALKYLPKSSREKLQENFDKTDVIKKKKKKLKDKVLDIIGPPLVGVVLAGVCTGGYFGVREVSRIINSHYHRSSVSSRPASAQADSLGYRISAEGDTIWSGDRRITP